MDSIETWLASARGAHLSRGTRLVIRFQDAKGELRDMAPRGLNHGRNAPYWVHA